MDRFKMSFNKSGTIHHFNNNKLLANISSAPVLPVSTAPKSVALNASMIDRVYNAKPGCRACGKKVA